MLLIVFLQRAGSPPELPLRGSPTVIVCVPLFFIVPVFPARLRALPVPRETAVDRSELVTGNIFQRRALWTEMSMSAVVCRARRRGRPTIYLETGAAAANNFRHRKGVEQMLGEVKADKSCSRT